MELRLWGTRLQAHPLMVLLPLLAVMLGLRESLALTVFALALHETAHLAAARLLRVRVAQLRLMPFGGAAELDNIYTLSPGQLFAVAAAGPAANLLLVFTVAALCQWRLLSPAPAALAVRINLALMLFNLLPALPLDGGRMLYALTARMLGRARAVALGILLGRIVALGLLLLVLRGIVVTGRCNLSLAACAVFIAASGPDERRALARLEAVSPLNGLKALNHPLPLQLCAVSEDLSVLRALRQGSSASATLYAVYRGDRLDALADERALLLAALSRSDAVVRDAACIPLGRR